MEQVKIGFKAFDLHELLVHFVAVNLGLYEQNGIEARLKDTALIQDDSLHSPEYLVACGSALTARLKGIPWKVVFVTTDNPLFWLYSMDEFFDANDLRGKIIAGYPSTSPPGRFLRIILRNYGIEPDSDLTIEDIHDDFTRLGLLRAKQVDAAMISSAIPPPKIEKMGIKSKLFFGDHLKIPTTGLAVRDDVIQENPDQVRKMVRIFQSSLTTVLNSPNQTILIIADLINDTAQVARETYDLLIPLLTISGKIADAVTEKAIQLLAKELSLDTPPPNSEVYDFSFQTS